MPTETDRIERSIVIQAPRERVWQALTDTSKFSTWFKADIAGQTFTPGQRVRGPVHACGHENVFFDIIVDRVEAPKVFSYRWHPAAMDPAVDYTSEEPTLVTFTLADAPDNATLLTLVESGFDKVPPQRRLDAFRMNGNGWDAQLGNLVNYVNA
ncbi:MAG: SRPBCC family protein [Pseudomonadota bacterium]